MGSGGKNAVPPPFSRRYKESRKKEWVREVAPDLFQMLGFTLLAEGR